MPKRNIMLALNATPKGGSPQNGFDLSSFDDLHQKGGMFNVVSVRETAPGSFYKIGVDGFTRTQLCNTANFAHMKENYYFLFVPYGLISRNAYQLLVDRKQPYTALDMGIEKFPTFSLETVLHRIVEIAQLDVSLAANAKFRDVHGFNIAFGACRLLDMLGYGYYTDIVEATKNVEGFTATIAKRIITALVYGKKPNANALAAYQCCWYHFFRNDIYDTDVSPKCFNFDDVTNVIDGNQQYNYDILATRTVDDFIVDCCQLRYVPYKKDIFTGAMPGTQFGPVSSIGIDVDFSNLSGSVNVNGSATLNGSTGYDANTHSYKYVTSQGGVQDLSFDELGHYDGDTYIAQKTLSQVNNLRDPETGKIENFSNTVYGSRFNPIDPDFPQGDEALMGFKQLQGSRDEVYRNAYDVHNHSISGTASISSTGTISGFSGSAHTLFDVLKLVEAQAIQKWRQKSMLAGNKTVNQFRAHHGVVPRHLVDHMPDFIGSVDNTLNVTEITSQADTALDADESNLGEIRGRGYGASNSRTFDFKCDDYGLLIVLHSIVPENVYCSFGIDQYNTKTVYTDFYQNEYQNIGLQFVPKYLLAPSRNGDNPANPDQDGSHSFQSGGFGYAPRYFDYKQRVSKVHGLFNTTRIVSTGIYRPLDIFGYADMQSFVMSRRDLVQAINVDDNGQVTLASYGMQLSNLYVNPRIFDSIFAREADDFQDTDTFFSHIRVICDASQPMSVLGLPQF